MDLRCELCKNKCCIYLPEVPQTERKGRKDRSESARRTGLRLPDPVQKAGMDNVHLVVHVTYTLYVYPNTKSKRVYGFRKENQLIVLQYEHT